MKTMFRFIFVCDNILKAKRHFVFEGYFLCGLYKYISSYSLLLSLCYGFFYEGGYKPDECCDWT